jgi:hypothetical protein
MGSQCGLHILQHDLLRCGGIQPMRMYTSRHPRRGKTLDTCRVAKYNKYITVSPTVEVEAHNIDILSSRTQTF